MTAIQTSADVVGPPTPRDPVARPRLRRLLGAGGAVAVLAVCGAGAASADSVDGQGYWADDGCYYSVEGGQWTGSSCVAAYVDSAGQVSDGVYSVHAYDPTAPGKLGVLQLQLDLRDPAYVVLRDPSSATFTGGAWARQLAGVPTAPVEITVWNTATGGWEWQAFSTSSGTPPLTASDGPVLGVLTDVNGQMSIGGGAGANRGLTGNLEIDALVAASKQQQITTVLQPNCVSMYVHCY